MAAKDLIKLTFHKNSDEKYHCPVTFKVFNENSHIVAIRPSGNVFSYDVSKFIFYVTIKFNKAGFLQPHLISDEVEFFQTSQQESSNMNELYIFFGTIIF